MTLTVDVQLELGTASQTVEVQAAGAELQVLNSTIGNSVASSALEALPRVNRDVATFVERQPGVSRMAALPEPSWTRVRSCSTAATTPMI